MNRSTEHLIVEGKKSYGSKSKDLATGSTKAAFPVDYGSGYNSPYGPEITQDIPINCQAELNKLAREQQDSLNGSYCYACCHRAKWLLKNFSGTALWILVFSATLLLPVIAIIIGSVYFNDCPREWRIPLFLVVGGSLAVCSNSVNIIYRVVHRGLPSASESQRESAVYSASNRVVGILTSVLHCCAIVWFFTGCIWVYDAYSPTSGEGLNYCKPQVYFLAFWLLNICFIMFFVALITWIIKRVISSLRRI